jgi:hypothetical protein
VGIRVARFVALLLAALSLTMTSAHVLELPQKMRYPAELYAAVNGTLYRQFAIVGGSYTIGAMVAAAVLAVLARRHRAGFGWAAAGAACLVIAFVMWLGIVNPVNLRMAEALRTAPETVPQQWMLYRGRWEYGHAAGFVVQLAGFCALLVSALADARVTSAPSASPDGARTPLRPSATP